MQLELTDIDCRTVNRRTLFPLPGQKMTGLMLENQTGKAKEKRRGRKREQGRLGKEERKRQRGRRGKARACKLHCEVPLMAM